jgi:uncharacterized MAPEG superfamily protein
LPIYEAQIVTAIQHDGNAGFSARQERVLMTLELYALLATAVLLLVLALVSTALYGAQVGNSALTSNREGIAPATGVAGRAQRAHRNLLENAVPFAAAVLTAQVLHVTTLVTQYAALLFIGARVVHAVVYIAGIEKIRTLAWLAGLLATVAIVYVTVML